MNLMKTKLQHILVLITAPLLPLGSMAQLQLHLPFDTAYTDGSGNLISPDISGFGRDAYLNLAASNTLYGVSGATIVPGGISGNALQLDGVNDFARVLAWSGISGSGARSIVLWVKQSSSVANPNDIWVGWGNPGTPARVRWDFGLQNSVDNAMRVELNASFAASPAGATIADNQWHQVAVTYAAAATNVSFYFDGSLFGTATFSATPVATDISGSLGIAIGAGIREVASTLGNANRFVNGLIDDVRIYNTALTAGEIYDLYVNIPEPTTGALLLGGFLALAAWRGLRRK